VKGRRVVKLGARAVEIDLEPGRAVRLRGAEMVRA
jgi:hypothetical protein